MKDEESFFETRKILLLGFILVFKIKSAYLCIHLNISPRICFYDGFHKFHLTATLL